MENVQNKYTEGMFSTRDLHLASVLVAMKFLMETIDYQVEGDKPRPIGYFGFRDTEELRNTIKKYRQKMLAIEPQDLFSAMRTLRAEVNNAYKNPHSKF